MTKGVRAEARAIFIKEMITASSSDDMIAAYRKAYPTCKKDTTARVQAYKLLQEPDIKEAIEAAKQLQADAIAAAQKEQLIEEAKKGIADVSQIDAQLSRIVLGRHLRNKQVLVFNPELKIYQKVTIQEEPSAAEIVAAADKLFKRFGKYAPKALQHEGGDSLIEFLKQFTNLNNNGDADEVSEAGI